MKDAAGVSLMSRLQRRFTRQPSHRRPVLAKVSEAEQPLAVPHLWAVAAQEGEESSPTRESFEGPPDLLAIRRAPWRTDSNVKA